LIIGVKQLTIDEVDKPQEVEADSDDDGGVTKRPNDNPSMAALAKMEDFIIPYTEDGRAEAATKNPHLKLLFTLIGFEIVDKGETYHNLC
jgi:replication fork protection complex subunit Tof1/Swi1